MQYSYYGKYKMQRSLSVKNAATENPWQEHERFVVRQPYGLVKSKQANVQFFYV